MLPGAIGEAIFVVDKSGTAINTSKTILNVFKEARDAYRERKAEINAVRSAELEEKRARKALARARITEIDDGYSVTSRDSRRSKSRRHHGDREGGRGGSGQRHRHRDRDLEYIPERGGLARRHTTASPSISPTSPSFYEGNNRTYRGDLDRSLPPTPTRSRTSPAGIDMDLAYGDVPPPRTPDPTDDEAELASLLTKVNFVLDEAHCLQHSVTTTIANLQKNPDALAAVALTLAEISNLVAKMAPGALAALKGGFPAVFAILASPQFMIAAGVGVGVTVVALGGYKIIKKMQGRNSLPPALGGPTPGPQMAQLEGLDISSIDRWRRGIADVEAQSVGTSVDGEFITPEAHAIRMAVEAQQDRREGARDRGRRRGDSFSVGASSPSERGGGSASGGRKKGGKKGGRGKKGGDEKERKMSKVISLFKHGNSVIA
ncbi:hypothetical protein FGG08_000715 [Glutinoglossum americanum]|uniref:Uncharacterized protein n=1 Tax=Glutinoglossum americanum TaxID=1670608 RepID=A0A9P8L3K5_9PEZI|nr:hypothetical protein FGG08_000715 [Glutinoglossum americanum]